MREKNIFLFNIILLCSYYFDRYGKIKTGM